MHHITLCFDGLPRNIPLVPTKFSDPKPNLINISSVRIPVILSVSEASEVLLDEMLNGLGQVMIQKEPRLPLPRGDAAPGIPPIGVVPVLVLGGPAIQEGRVMSVHELLHIGKTQESLAQLAVLAHYFPASIHNIGNVQIGEWIRHALRVHRRHQRVGRHCEQLRVAETNPRKHEPVPTTAAAAAAVRGEGVQKRVGDALSVLQIHGEFVRVEPCYDGYSVVLTVVMDVILGLAVASA